MHNQILNKHYIRTSDFGHIIQGWSDGPQPSMTTGGAIRLTDQGSYQFRLHPGGEENPSLFNGLGVPLYKWDGRQVIRRTQSELDADAPSPEIPRPTLEERLAAMEGAVKEITGGLSSDEIPHNPSVVGPYKRQ